jgi:hypothetical protein
MKQQSYHWRTTALPAAIRRAVLYGGAYAGIGGGLLLYAAIYLPLEALESWGWLIFLVAIALMLWGLLPYRRLKQQQLSPDEIEVTGDGRLLYHSKNASCEVAAIAEISALKFQQSWRSYGIEIHSKRVDNKEAIIFLPFFSQRSCKEIFEHILGFHKIFSCQP